MHECDFWLALEGLVGRLSGSGAVGWEVFSHCGGMCGLPWDSSGGWMSLCFGNLQECSSFSKSVVFYQWPYSGIIKTQRGRNVSILAVGGICVSAWLSLDLYFSTNKCIPGAITFPDQCIFEWLEMLITWNPVKRLVLFAIKIREEASNVVNLQEDQNHKCRRLWALFIPKCPVPNEFLSNCHVIFVLSKVKVICTPEVLQLLAARILPAAHEIINTSC